MLSVYSAEVVSLVRVDFLKLTSTCRHGTGQLQVQGSAGLTLL
jgi:hypothetical protein